MYITRIKITNFRIIKEIDIDLTINKNQIEPDVALSRFKLLDNTKPVSAITALIGRNSVGKSTIIKALSFVKDAETGFINQAIVNNLLKKEWETINSTIFSGKQTLNNKDLFAINKEFAQKSQEIAQKIVKKESLAFKKYLAQASEWYYDYFHENCHTNKSKSIIFEIHFVDKNNKYGTYKIQIDNEGNIFRNTNGDFKINDYHNYFQMVFAPVRTYKLASLQSFDFPKETKNTSSYYDFSRIEQALANMIAMVGEITTSKIIRLCDEDVLGIKYTEDKNKKMVQIKGIIIENKVIQPANLSSGTKQFLILTEAIVRAYKNKKREGLLLFDEIDINLHNELIQAFFQMLIGLFKDSNIQSIVTTHNLKALKPLLSNKQILSIEKNGGAHQVIKASQIMKPHENLETKQKQNLLAYYPDKELIRNTIADFIYELKKT